MKAIISFCAYIALWCIVPFGMLVAHLAVLVLNGVIEGLQANEADAAETQRNLAEIHAERE